MPRKLSPFSSSGRLRMVAGNRRSVKSRSRAPKPRRLSIKGKGGYWGRLIGGKLGGLIGKADLGAQWGDKAGDFIADEVRSMGPVGAGLVAAANAMAPVTGRGAYIMNDTFVNAGQDLIPKFHKASDGTSVTISHTEFIKDIVPTGAAFDLHELSLQPGRSSYFPWLSGIAANFEQYEFKQLMYCYRSTVSDIGNSSNGQVGTIVMVPTYNVKQESFVDKQQMLSNDNAVSGKTTDTMTCGIECDPRKLAGDQYKFVRTASVNEYDLQDYDHGKFNLAVCTPPSGYTSRAIGELWVSYTVHLSKPVAAAVRGETARQDVYHLKKDITDRYANGAIEVGVMHSDTGSGLTDMVTGQANNLGTSVTMVANGTNGWRTRIYMPQQSGVFRILARMRTTTNVAFGLTGLTILYNGTEQATPYYAKSYLQPATDVAQGHITARELSITTDPAGGTRNEYISEFTIRWDASRFTFIDMFWNVALGVGVENIDNQTLIICQDNPLFYDNSGNLRIIAKDNSVGIL